MGEKKLLLVFHLNLNAVHNLQELKSKIYLIDTITLMEIFHLFQLMHLKHNLICVQYKVIKFIRIQIIGKTFMKKLIQIVAN